MERADLIVIGSGQGGVPLAVDFAKAGKNVVLFERGKLGGSCVNYGCTPSKTFLGAAHAAGRARRAANMGVHADVRVDYAAVMDRTRRVRDEWQDEVEKKIAKAGVRLVRAEASFTGPRTVAGGGASVEAPIVVIDTGTSSLIPEVPGLAGTPYLTNVSFFELSKLPARFLVLGGGYIGLELGQGMARCGSEVHIIDHNAHVFAREERDVSETLETSLRQDGMALHLNSKVGKVEHDPKNGFAVTLDGGTRIEGEALLVATGRVPNTRMLNGGASGIELDARGHVKIDDQFRTTCAGVYAIGDAAGQPAFTHVSWEDHRRLEDILAGGRRTRSDRVLGYATYTEPQVGRAGMTLDEAKNKGLKARAVTLPLERVARAVEWDLEMGFYRMVVDDDTERILGATLVGYEAAELVHVFIAHMEAGSTWRVLERSVHIHPTFAEGLPSLARLLVAG
jgi:pyruvate/2-oxoglutarate dehydrogenase complex dihydrolipoamide dehydrogenase (E3) component